MIAYNLASSKGDIIGFESTFDDINILQPKRDILVHSNHYLTERFKKGDSFHNKDRRYNLRRIHSSYLFLGFLYIGLMRLN